MLTAPALNHRATPNRGIESSATAGTGTPQVAGHGINPPKLKGFGGRTSPNRLGQRSNTFNYFEDTQEIAPTAYREGRLLMPQATEQAQN